MNKLDDFFKEKLYNYKKETPDSAWDKINSQLAQPAWYESKWRIAAAILLLCLCTIVIWKFSSRDGNDFIAEQPIDPTQPVEIDSTKKQQKQIERQKESAEKKTIEPLAEKSPRQIEKSNVEKRMTPQSQQRAVETELSSSIYNEVVQEEIAVVDLPSVEQNLDSRINEALQNSDDVLEVAANSSTIVLTKEEVNNKYLKKNIEEEATPDEENASTLRKLLDKAYALKHNQDPVGELRQKKDEILALNFSKEKRSQNRQQ